MRKATLWKNRKAIKIYAAIAIILISIFQVYWLSSVFQSEKSIILRESENILKTAIFETEIARMEAELKDDTYSGLSGIDDITRQLMKVVKNNKDVQVKITMDDGTSNDSVSKQLMEKLTAEPGKKFLNKSEDVYKSIKLPMSSAFPNLKFKVYDYEKDKVSFYPKNNLEIHDKTQTIRSDRDSRQSYEIHFGNIAAIVLQKMTGSIILSIIYMILYISAIILLISNVNKSRKLMQQKDNFTNNMTHEFKTPMSTIYAAIEALNKYDILDDKEMTKEYLGLMKGDLDRLINMTDSILYNAKMSDGKIALQLKKIDLRDFVAGIVENLKPVLVKKNASVEINAIDPDIFITIDQEHFGNVFRNLIDNSIKYSEEDAKINITMTKQGNFARILFSDKGIGIPDKFKGEIFKSYFRVMEKDMYTVKGYGLGLSYVKEIIDLHKGKIQAMKTAEKGTTFEILIPLNNG